MATRRPKVPSAQLRAGSAPDAEPTVTAPPREHPARRTPVSSGPRKSAPGTPAGPRGPRSRQGEAAPADSPADPVPARRFSGRLVVIGLAMAVVTVVLAPNVHTFMEQRAEISALQSDIAAKTAEQAAFETEIERWSDPAFVKQQARDRVSMLMPGETGYWVYGADGMETVAGTSEAEQAAAAAATSAKNATSVSAEPWVARLLASITASAAVAAEPAPAPAEPAPGGTPAEPPAPAP